MDFNDIQDKDIKIVLHLLDILQNSRLLSKEEKEIYDTLVESFYDDNDERSAIYNYAQSNKWIDAPDGFKNNRGGKNYYPIDSKQIHDNIKITPKVQKTVDIHPPKTGISVHFSDSFILVALQI